MARPPKEYTEFTKLTDNLLKVSRAELQKKLDAHKAESAANPKRRGPKPKAVTPSDDASSHDAL